MKGSQFFFESQQCRLSCHKQERFPEALLGGGKARAHPWLMLQQKSFRETQAFIDRLRQQPLLSTTEEHKQKPKVSVSLTGKKIPSSLKASQHCFQSLSYGMKLTWKHYSHKWDPVYIFTALTDPINPLQTLENKKGQIKFKFLLLNSHPFNILWGKRPECHVNQDKKC